ncbi:hypothetical protein WDW86_07185, partial [Bdellovibrionota bacterium FG-2]
RLCFGVTSQTAKLEAYRPDPWALNFTLSEVAAPGEACGIRPGASPAYTSPSLRCPPTPARSGVDFTAFFPDKSSG